MAKYDLHNWWRGDGHTHSIYSTRDSYNYAEGIYSVTELLEYFDKIDLDFVCFSEHSSKPSEPHKLEFGDKICKSLLKEQVELEEINRSEKYNIALFGGVEANIFYYEGKPIIDVPDHVLQQLDLVIASRHGRSGEKDILKIKETLLYAAQHPLVQVIGHPDRYTRNNDTVDMNYWNEYWAIWFDVCKAIVKHNKAFEININSQPDQKLVDIAIEAGCKFVINLDAHDWQQFSNTCDEACQHANDIKEKWSQHEANSYELKEFEDYKNTHLNKGPGIEATKRLYKWIQYLGERGVEPDRVLNSSLENLLRFIYIDHKKTTPNLEYLVQRYL